MNKDATKQMDRIKSFLKHNKSNTGKRWLVWAIEGKKVIKQKMPYGGTDYFDLLLKRV